MPSLKSNNYIISILNPYIMYKKYYTSEDIMDFNITFKTINNGPNITITPNFDKYSINNKILEGYSNIIEITKNEGRILLILLTKPSNNEKYLFTQMEIFTPDISVEYEFYNSIYIKVSFDEKDQNKIKFNQPIGGERFNDTIFIDKKDYLPKHNYNLCNVTKSTKLAHLNHIFIIQLNISTIEGC